MASENSMPENNHHAHGMETILPLSISKLERSLPATPKIERSMADSFMMTRPQTPDSDDAHAITPPEKDEPLMPLSSWAHFSLIKTQRNTLRTELRAEQIAGAEARASIAALRRLAFRLAISISVKEKQVAKTARSLASSRKDDYVASRNAGKKIEMLTKSLKEEERRNREILETLEQASKLTLQYATPNQKPQHRLQPSPMTPPSSPPTRLASLGHLESAPKTPSHSPASSGLWDQGGIGFTPDSSGILPIRTRDERLIQAKRDSERALLACRNRIALLQSECLRSKESAQFLEVTQMALEGEIQDHQSRIVSLEKSRTAIEETLRSAQCQVRASADSDAQLRVELESKSQEIGRLEEVSRQRQEDADSLEKSKCDLEVELVTRNGRIQEFASHITALDNDLRRLRSRLDDTEHRERDLRRQLADHKDHHAQMDTEFQRSQATVGTLEQAVAFVESQVKEYKDKIQSLGGEVSFLRDGLRTSEGLKEGAESGLATAQLALAELAAQLRSAIEENAALQIELESTRTEKSDVEAQLSLTDERLGQGKEARMHLQSEVQSSIESKHALQEQLLQTGRAKSRLHDELLATRQELTESRESRTTLQEDLDDVRRSKADLEREFQAANDVLGISNEARVRLQTDVSRTEKANTELQDTIQKTDIEIQRLEQSSLSLQKELSDANRTTSELQDELHAFKHESVAMKSDIEALREELKISDELKSELQEELRQVQESKTRAEERLTGSLAYNAELSSESQAQIQVYQDKVAMTEASIADVQDKLKSSAESNVELEEQLRKTLRFKVQTEDRLSEMSATHTDLSTKLETSAQSHRDKIAIMDASLSSLQHELKQCERSAFDLQKELEELRRSKAQVEGRLADTSIHNTRLEEDLNTSHASLLQAERDTMTFKTKLDNADKELDALRHTNSNLEQSESDLLRRLATAEEELESVRRTNKELSRFLEQVEKDMVAAESAVEDSENQLDKFVEESNALLNAAQESEGRYKGQLSTKGKELQKTRNNFVASLHVIEQELKTLREDKNAFQDIVKALREKTAERNRPSEPTEWWTSARPRQDKIEEISATPAVERPTLSSKPSSIGHASIEHTRPETSESVEIIESWAKQVERVRMLRDKTAIKLKGMDKAKHDLKKTLKDSEAQLDRLEKQGKPKRQPTLLYKCRPTTATPTLSLLPHARPQTAGAPLTPFHPKPKPTEGAPGTAESHWHSPSLSRPTTSRRPHSSFGRLVSIGGKRPSTKGSDVSASGSEKKRFRSSLRRLFKGDKKRLA